MAEFRDVMLVAITGISATAAMITIYNFIRSGELIKELKTAGVIA